jgi:thymidylate kinase
MVRPAAPNLFDRHPYSALPPAFAQPLSSWERGRSATAHLICRGERAAVALYADTLLPVTPLFAVWGAAPGIGKSTLSAGLARWLTETGRRVDHFREEDLFTRPQFADVAAHFRATGQVEPGMLQAATSRFARSVLASDIDVVVADALVPFVPSLLAMGCSEDEIRQFVADLTTELAPIELTLVFLDGDPAAALARAAGREDTGWLQWYTRKLARYGLTPEPGDLASAVTYLERERTVTLAAVRCAAWRVIVIERATELSADEILRSALRQLGQEANTPPSKSDRRAKDNRHSGGAQRLIQVQNGQALSCYRKMAPPR